MKILILTVGTRGDIQPYVAIGIGLQKQGHTVRLCAPEKFRALVTDYEIGFSPMPNDILDLLDSPTGRKAVEETQGVWGAARTTLKLIRRVKPIQQGIMQACWNAAQDFAPEGLIFHAKTLCGTHIAERLNIPVIMSLPLPAMIPTADFPLMGLPHLTALPKWLQHTYHQQSYALGRLGINAYRGLIQSFRTETLGLPKQKNTIDFLEHSDGSPLPFLHLYSTKLLPRPSDWPEHIGVTGYAFLPTRPWSMPEDLATFLAQGPPPFYIGFGSIGGKDPQNTTRVILQAIQQANVRAVIATGWGGLESPEALIPKSVHLITSAPHDHLLPQMAGVVHHGGAGSTAAGLRAGKATLICPFFGDQPFWGERVHALGLGPKPLPQKSLTVKSLTERLRQLKHHAQYTQNAQHMGESLKEEHGINQAVTFIESYLKPDKVNGNMF